MRGMTPQQLLDHYGTQAKIARALGCTQPAVYEWFEKDKVPDGRQVQVERLTDGALAADAGCMDRLLGMDKLKAQETAHG